MAKKNESKASGHTQARSKPKKKKDLPRSISGALLEGKK